MDGLEVKVQLGTVWKQSLTELSGGQRCVIRERQTNKKRMNRLIQIVDRSFPHNVPPSVQACAYVHSGRD